MKATYSEAEFQSQIIQLAAYCGWRAFHVHDSRRCAPGFPDLVLVRKVVIYAELKSKTGRLTPEQKQWLDALTNAGQDCRVWRPTNWPEIEQTLKG